MITNPSSSALNIISNAQFKLADAANKIATLPVEKDEVGSLEFDSSDLIKPILSLKEAELEYSAGAKVLQAENERLGFLFDAIS